MRGCVDDGVIENLQIGLAERRSLYRRPVVKRGRFGGRAGGKQVLLVGRAIYPCATSCCFTRLFVGRPDELKKELITQHIHVRIGA